MELVPEAEWLVTSRLMITGMPFQFCIASNYRR
jgi:hypothetical protein